MCGMQIWEPKSSEGRLLYIQKCTGCRVVLTQKGSICVSSAPISQCPKVTISAVKEDVIFRASSCMAGETGKEERGGELYEDYTSLFYNRLFSGREA